MQCYAARCRTFHCAHWLPVMPSRSQVARRRALAAAVKESLRAQAPQMHCGQGALQQHATMMPITERRAGTERHSGLPHKAPMAAARDGEASMPTEQNSACMPWLCSTGCRAAWRALCRWACGTARPRQALPSAHASMSAPPPGSRDWWAGAKGIPLHIAYSTSNACPHIALSVEVPMSLHAAAGRAHTAAPLHWMPATVWSQLDTGSMPSTLAVQRVVQQESSARGGLGTLPTMDGTGAVPLPTQGTLHVQHVHKTETLEYMSGAVHGTVCDVRVQATPRAPAAHLRVLLTTQESTPASPCNVLGANMRRSASSDRTGAGLWVLARHHQVQETLTLVGPAWVPPQTHQGSRQCAGSALQAAHLRPLCAQKGTCHTAPRPPRQLCPPQVPVTSPRALPSTPPRHPVAQQGVSPPARLLRYTWQFKEAGGVDGAATVEEDTQDSSDASAPPACPAPPPTYMHRVKRRQGKRALPDAIAVDPDNAAVFQHAVPGAALLGYQPPSGALRCVRCVHGGDAASRNVPLRAVQVYVAGTWLLPCSVHVLDAGRQVLAAWYGVVAVDTGHTATQLPQTVYSAARTQAAASVRVALLDALPPPGAAALLAQLPCTAPQQNCVHMPLASPAGRHFTLDAQQDTTAQSCILGSVALQSCVLHLHAGTGEVCVVQGCAQGATWETLSAP